MRCTHHGVALCSNTSCAQRSVATWDMLTPLPLLLPWSAAAGAAAPAASAAAADTMDTSWCVTTLQGNKPLLHRSRFLMARKAIDSMQQPVCRVESL
jgi:hypothetical protein